MKKIYSFLLLFAAVAFSRAATHTVTIVGTSYSPATLNVNVGDVVTIQASGAHPLVQVDQPTWNADGSTPMSGGWGTKTANYTFTVTSAGTTYYVCSAHVGMGMKGQIIAASGTGLSSLTATNNEVSVFPNPASDKIHVKLNVLKSAEASVKLYALDGKLVSDLKTVSLNSGENDISLEIQLISSGHYILAVESENVKISKQVSINR